MIVYYQVIDLKEPPEYCVDATFTTKELAEKYCEQGAPADYLSDVLWGVRKVYSNVELEVDDDKVR